MKNSSEIWKKSLDNAFNELPKSNINITLDNLKYQNMVKEDGELDEKWSEKYKKSINCNNPKGFSQRAHCQGRKKKIENSEATGSGSSGQYSTPLFSGEEPE